MPEFTTLISGLSFTECPRWHDGRLYVSDFYTQRVRPWPWMAPLIP